MYSFSKRSKDNLSQCHSDIQVLFNEVIKEVDCAVICGSRGEDAQNKAYAEGFSTKKFPESKHNNTPSLAADVVPWPLDWDDIDSFKKLGKIVLRIAKRLKCEGKIKSSIRWGGNFKTWKDYPHYEIL